MWRRRELDGLNGYWRGGQDPEAGFVHTVVTEAAGTPRALAPLYMAAARQLGFPLEICNCSLSFKSPVEFLVVLCPPQTYRLLAVIRLHYCCPYTGAPTHTLH
jgi:hypothetical protein